MDNQNGTKLKRVLGFGATYGAAMGRDRRKFCVIDEPRQYENLRLSQE